MYEQLNQKNELKGRKLINKEKDFFKEVILIEMKISTKSFITAKLVSIMNFWVLFFAALLTIFFLIFGWKRGDIVVAGYNLDSISVVSTIHSLTWKVIDIISTKVLDTPFFNPEKSPLTFPAFIPCFCWFCFIMVNSFKSAMLKEYKFYRTNIIYCSLYILFNALSLIGIIFGVTSGGIFLFNYIKQNKLLHERLLQVKKNPTPASDDKDDEEKKSEKSKSKASEKVTEEVKESEKKTEKTKSKSSEKTAEEVKEQIKNEIKEKSDKKVDEKSSGKTKKYEWD